METELKGKKLLILGGTRDEISLVLRAQELGIYVVVTDFFTDRTISPAKNIANEAWDYSWMDVDLIASKCKEHEIDGITAGYSEIKVDYLIRICKKLGLPCYATEKQLEITRDKKKFKDECRKCGVPTVKEFDSPEAVDEYPVIVKPVDRAGSIGISVANNQEELMKAYTYAKGTSLGGEVIIEKYMDATKVDVYYAVEDGVATPITTCDTIMSPKNGRERVVQNAWLYPHREKQKLLETQDANLKRMISDMGIQYGCIFFSGFLDDQGDYSFFECGFRLEGGFQYEYSFRCGYMNFLDIFIVHALTGSTKVVSHNPVSDDDLKMCTVNLYAKKGILAGISGFSEVSAWPECTLSHISGKIGEVCEDDKAILAKIGMFSIADDSSEKIRHLVEKALNIIQIKDENGNDMIYDRVDTSIIPVWWSNGIDG